MANYKDKKYRGSSNKMKNDKDLGIDDLKLVSFSSLSTNEVLCYNGTNWVNGTVSGGGGSISCFSYDSGSSALVATADLTSTCSALFGDVLISGNTITPDDSNTVTCLGADGTLNISGNLDVQGDFLKLPQATSSSTIAGNTASAGALRYNTTTNTIQVHNGTEFTDTQSALVSGTNIKTVNGESLLGSGNITTQSALVSGTNIKTVNGESLLGSGNITISVDGDVVSDTTPQLGGNLDLNGKTINGTGNLDISNGTIKLAGNYPTGTGNVALGCLAGNSIGGSAAANTFIGNRAGTNSDHPAINNVAVGHFALACNTGGPDNTAVGSQAIQSVTGTGNVGLGRCAGHAITSGSNNIVIGTCAAASSATVSNEITLGDANITSLRIPGLQSGATDGDVLTFCSANSNLVLKAAGGGASSLNELSDVTYETTTENLGIGTNALDSLQVGSPYNPTGNIAIGFNAGTNVSIAGHNIVLGYNALCNGCNVGLNVAIGCDALKELPQGYCNTAIGPGALRCQTNQSGQNTAVGAFAGASITTGCRNTIIGIQAGGKMTDRCGNTIAGYLAQGKSTATGGHYNTIVGQFAGHANAGGCCNVYMGSEAAMCATNSNNSVAIGYRAACNISTANCHNNVVIGAAAGCSTHFKCSVMIGQAVNAGATFNSAGPDKSVLIGHRAGYKALCEEQVMIGHCAGYCTTGNRNVFMGASAGRCNTTGGSNVYIGFEAGQVSCTGYANIGIGSEALKLVKGNCNIAIGTSAGFNTASQTGCNTIVIGNYAQASSASASNEITLGNNSISTIRANVTSISSLSDQRDKTNICDLSVGLCFVDELKPVTFDWNRRDGTMSGQKDVGFIAQDLDSLQQKYNIEDHLNIVLKSNPDRLEASPGKLIPILVKAIQELTEKVKQLEIKIGK
jgi:hypothetical protein